MHEMKVKIRSTQVDTFGHLNNAAYLEIYEWARWEWASADGPDPINLVAERGLGPAIVHIDLDFYREIQFHDAITVRTWFKELTGTKGIICQEMLRSDGVVASKVLITFVMFNLKTRKVVPIPEEMRRLYDVDEAYRRACSGPGLKGE